MLQLNNKTPFESEGVVSTDATGRDSLVITVKGTFHILPKVTVAKDQEPVTLVDEYLGEPGFSSLAACSDVLLPKPGFDVLLRGSAHAPNERAVASLNAALVFQDIQKVVKVTGNRIWKAGRSSHPEPFTEMPLLYENAFGGTHHFQPEQPMGPDSCVYVPDNPVGSGYRGKRKSSELEGMRLPNIEHPESVIHEPAMKSRPIGFGPIAPFWVPRKQFAGTYDENWVEQVAPALPKDFDPRFFQVGSEGLCFPSAKLLGGESVRLVNLARDSDIRFDVPLCPLHAVVKILSSSETVELNMETLLIEPDQNHFCLVWKGIFPCERKATMIEEVTIDFGSIQ